jgi:hypothetical protein
MKSNGILLALACVALLAGCTSSTMPTAPAKAFRDPATHKVPKGVYALCYGRGLNSPEDIRADIMEVCPKGSRGFEILGQDSVWNNCPLLQPVRLTYRCGPVAGQ